MQSQVTPRSNYDSSGIHTGLAIGDVFADYELTIIANRKSVFENAVKSPYGFKNGVFALLGKYNEENAKAAQNALDSVKQLAADELSKSYSVGVQTVDRTIDHYKGQGFKPPREPEKKTGQSLLLFTALATAISAFAQLSNYARGAAAGQVINIAGQVNPNAEDVAAEIDRVQSAYLKRGIPGKSLATGAEKEMTAEAEFLARDGSHKILLHAEAERQKEYGLNLIQVSAHPSSCELCVPWQLKILVNDLDGGVPDGKHPLLSEAIDAGLMHYNCRHNYVVYVPGLSKPDLFANEKASAYETAKRYAYEQEQRYNERMIRAWKREMAGVQSDFRRQQAEARVSEWQAKQRALGRMADKEGVPFYRQYSREQIKGKTDPALPSVSNAFVFARQ